MLVKSRIFFFVVIVFFIVSFVLFLAYTIYAIKCIFYSPLVSFDCNIFETTCQANVQIGAEPNLSRKHKIDKIIGMFARKRIYNGCSVRIENSVTRLNPHRPCACRFRSSLCQRFSIDCFVKRTNLSRKPSSTSSIHFSAEIDDTRSFVFFIKLFIICSYTSVTVTLCITATIEQNRIFFICRILVTTEHEACGVSIVKNKSIH